MSLQVWLPLMGDTHNQGLGRYTISTLGTLSWVAGKLGATAMRAGDGTQVVNGLQVNTNFADLLNEDHSVSVWIKPYGTHVHYNGSIMSSGNWNTANKRWAFGVSQDNSKVDVLCMNYNTYITCAIPTNEWTHLVCVRKGAVVKLYKNGVYINSRDCSSDPVFDSDASVTCIGRESYASGYFSFNGAIQDLRLYSHALGEKEIKQLSQGLILHYPLNRNGWGQENLATCTTPQYNISASTGNYNYFWIAGAGTLTAGKTYTVSAEVTVSDNIERCTIYNYHTNPTTGGPQYNYFPADGKRHSWTFTASATGLLGYCGVAGATANHTAVYKNIKIEEGEIATPYIPRSNETLYTTMGLSGIIEYDCSGFNNNGTINGTPEYTNDTSKYSISRVFNGTNNPVGLPNLSTLIQDGSFTFSVWFKKETDQWSSKGWETIFGGPSGFEFQAKSSTTNSPLLYAYSWNKGTYAYTLDEWHHFVMVRTTAGTTFYLDGVQIFTGTAGSIPSGNYFVGSWSTATGQNFKGKMSDVRIYATALSAADVLELYKSHK